MSPRVCRSRSSLLALRTFKTNQETFATSAEFRYSKALWFFAGRNNHPTLNFQGRGKHTDNISHYGTFHLQVSSLSRSV